MRGGTKNSLLSKSMSMCDIRWTCVDLVLSVPFHFQPTENRAQQKTLALIAHFFGFIFWFVRTATPNNGTLFAERTVDRSTSGVRCELFVIKQDYGAANNNS